VPDGIGEQVKLTKQKLAGAIGIAVDEARENPSLEAADIVNSVFARVVEEVGDDEPASNDEVKQAAHKRLHAAADQLQELGDTAEKPLVNALIGIGLALLANGEDAELFYAFFLAGKEHSA